MENLNKDFTLVGSKGSDSTEKIAKPALSFFQDAWRRFKKNKVALVAMWIIAITLVFSVISAFVVPQSKANYFDPNKSTLENILAIQDNFDFNNNKYYKLDYWQSAKPVPHFIKA